MAGCWLPLPLALVNAAELTGELIAIVYCLHLLFHAAIFIIYKNRRSEDISFVNRYILEGKELEFYMKKIQRKKGKGGAGAAA